MQSVTVSTAGTYPDATTVKAYLPSQIPGDSTGRRAPIGAAAAEAATSSGSLTLTGLTDGQAYTLAAEVNSKWVYMQIVAPVNSETGFSEVASANTITLPNGRLIKVTGTTEIKKVTAGAKGKVVTLLFAGSLTVKDGENLKLSADFSATADDTLTLISDGTNWYETGKAAN